MAEKRIEKNDIFEPGLLVDIINQTKELEKAVRGNIKAFSDLLKTNPFETVKDVKEYQAAVSGVVAGTQTLKTAQEENKKATDELNASLAREVAVSKQVKEELDDINGTLDQNIKLQTRRKLEIKSLKDEQTELNKLLKIGAISESKYLNATASLNKEIQQLTVANSKLGFTIKAQIKEGQAASTSFDQQAQRLGQLRAAYRKLSEEQRNNEEVGGSLLKSIKVLDKQVKANDASIGNFQRNVGNYTGSIKDAARDTGLFDGVLRKVALAQSLLALGQTSIAKATGKSTGALKIFKIALVSTGIGALVVALGSLIVFLTQSQKGIELTSKALAGIGAVVDVVVDRFSSIGSALVNLVKGDYKAAAEDFEKATSDVTEELKKEVKAAIELEEALIGITKAENDLILKRAATRRDVKELNKIAEDTTKSFSERSEAARQAIAIEQRLLDQQVNNQKQRAANLLGSLELTEEKLEDIRKNGLSLEDVGFSDSTEEERKEAIEAIAKIFELQESSLELQTTLNNKLNTIEQQREAKNKKAVEDRLKAEEKINAEKEKQREEPIDKIERNAFADQKEQNKKLLNEDKKFLAESTKQKKKQLDREEKLRKKSDQKAKEDREKQLQENIQTANQLAEGLANALDKRSQKRIDKIQEEETENDKALERQERRAEQGLSNEVAFNQKKAAELEQQREEEQRKAERNAKILSYFNLLSEYAKENPNTAAGKALAQVAIAETVSGLFYEGTDRVGDDTNPNPFMKGKDNTIIGVTPEERIFGHKQSLGIRAMFGSITNDQLIEYAKMGYNNSTTTTATLNDVRIVQAVRGVEQAVKSNQQVIEIDTLNQIVDSRINQHGMKTKRVHKRTRL